MPPQALYAPPPNNLPTGYEFLASPATPPRSSGPQSTIMRAVIVLGGLLVLLILFIIIKGLFNGTSNKAQLLSVVQDQQELIHLSTNAQVIQSLSAANKDFAITAQLGLTSEQSKLLSYAAKHGAKLNPKQLNLKVSLSTDTQLTSASAASTYDSTFDSIMKTKLNDYQSDLKQAYTKTKGSVGRGLLKEDYASASLLLLQLENPNN